MRKPISINNKRFETGNMTNDSGFSRSNTSQDADNGNWLRDRIG